MKKTIDEINLLIEDINVYINNLLNEQGGVTVDTGSTNSTAVVSTDEEELEKLKGKSKGGTISVKDVYTDVKNGDFEKIFPPDELEKLEKWRDSGYETGGYTIEDGKYAGKVITSATYDSIRVIAGYKSAKSKILKNRGPKYVAPDICNCIALARMFIDKDNPADEAAKCPSVPAICEEKFNDSFEAKVATYTKFKRETTEKYLGECKDEYLDIMFNRSKRDDYVLPPNKWCKKWETEAKPTIDSLESELNGLLNKWFRLSNKKDKSDLGDEKTSIADQIGSHTYVTILFDDDLTFSDGAPPFTDCTINALTPLNAGTPYKFTVINFSPFSKGNTVVLEISGKNAKMTFKTAEKGEPNRGKITWLDSASGDEKCASQNWKGRITRYDN